MSSQEPVETTSSTSTDTEEVSIPEAIVGPYDFDPKNVPLTDLKSLGETLAKVDTDDAKRICELINLYNNQPNNTLLLIELISYCNAYPVPRFFLFGARATIADTIPQIRNTAIKMVHNLITADSSTSSSAPAAPGLFPPHNTSSVSKTTEQKLNEFIKEHLFTSLVKGKTLSEIVDSCDDYIKFKLFVFSRISPYCIPTDDFISFKQKIVWIVSGNLQHTKKLKDEGFTAGELREAEFSTKILKAAGFSLSDLIKAGFSLFDLINARFFPRDFIKDGFSLMELIEIGFSLCDLKTDFSARELREATNENNERIFSDNQILQAGFLPSQLIEAGFSASQLREAGFSASQFRADGFSPMELIETGFSLSELREAGFSARQLKEATNENGARIFSDDEILRAGFPAWQLKEAGYTLEQLKDAKYTVDELLPYFTIDDLKAAGFTEDEINTALVIFESISKHKQDLQKEFFEKYCLVRCIDRPHEEKALLFEDEMVKLSSTDPLEAKKLKKDYTFRCASFIAQGLQFRFYHHGLFALYSNKSELAHLAGKPEIPFWGKNDLGSDGEWLKKNGAEPLQIIGEYRPEIEEREIEDYIAELRDSKPESINMPEALGNFKIENLLGIGIYVDGPDWRWRTGIPDEIRNKLANVKDFYEFLISKGVFVPLTIYTATKEHPGELEIFTDWKSFEYAVLAAIRRLADKPD